MKRIIPVLLIMIGSFIGLYRSQHPCVEAVDSTVQNGWQDGFQVKIERIPERCPSFLGTQGVSFVLSSKLSNSDEWRITNRAHSTHMIDIPPDAIVVESERVAIVSLMDVKVTLVDGEAVNIDFGAAK